MCENRKIDFGFGFEAKTETDANFKTEEIGFRNIRKKRFENGDFGRERSSGNWVTKKKGHQIVLESGSLKKKVIRKILKTETAVIESKPKTKPMQVIKTAQS